MYVSARLQSRADPAFAQYTGRLLSSLLSSTMHTSYIFLYSQLSNLQISHQLSVTLSNISQRIGPWHQERTSYRNHFAYPIQRLRSLLSTLERSRPSSLFTRSFLASHSPLYPAALKGSNAEAEAKMVDLGEVDVHTFDFFVHLLYFQRLPGSDDDAELYALWSGDVGVALARRRGAM